MKNVSDAGSADALAKLGPLFNVTLLPHPSVAKGLQQLGSLQVAQVALMLDTGAEKTVIEKAVAQGMGLTAVRFTPMVGVSQQPELCPVYLMTVRLGLADHRNRPSSMEFHAEIIGMNSPQHPQPHRGLLGRDFLRWLHIVYGGPTGRVEVTASKEITGGGRGKTKSPTAVKHVRKAAPQARKKKRRR